MGAKDKRRSAKPTDKAALYPRNLRGWDGKRWKLASPPRLKDGRLCPAEYRNGELRGTPSEVDRRAIEEGEPPVKVTMQLL